MSATRRDERQSERRPPGEPRADWRDRRPVDLARIANWYPVEVRYSDLDLQGHVNNATFFTYFEQARVRWLSEVRSRLADERVEGGDERVADVLTVVANASCAFRRPIETLAPVSVGVACARVGTASAEFVYAICDAPGGALYATGSTILVAVDGHGRPRPMPRRLREELLRADAR